jgi:hypothetical protein
MEFQASDPAVYLCRWVVASEYPVYFKLRIVFQKIFSQVSRIAAVLLEVV